MMSIAPAALPMDCTFCLWTPNDTKKKKVNHDSVSMDSASPVNQPVNSRAQCNGFIKREGESEGCDRVHRRSVIRGK